MFDTIQIRPTGIVETEAHHHEHRAPTDKSVELLRDMERAAESKTLSSHRLNNNIMDAVWHIREDFAAFELTGHCRFKLNGKEIEFEIPLDRRAQSHKHARQIIQEIANRISIELVKNLFVAGKYQTRLLGSGVLTR